VARPLINLFYPELSGLIQPLSGEYAGRRSLLETIPFFTSYAVEIGHLIDVAERCGLEGLGQVDLERRIHRNQELAGLSQMSFVILQAVMKRLEEKHKTSLFAELGSTMKLPRSGGGKLGLEVIELADHERPPMIHIPEYLEKRRMAAGAGNSGDATGAAARAGATGGALDGGALDGPAGGALDGVAAAEPPVPVEP
jgi:glucosyl-3-phosphoglycerate synthase